MTVGRPPKAREMIAEIAKLWREGVHTNQIAEQLNISRSSVYRYAPISFQDRYLRSLRAEANRHIKTKQRQIGLVEFRKGFPEMLEDYLLDETSDEEKIDDAMNLIGIDMTVWADRKTHLVNETTEKTQRYDLMQDPTLASFETDPKSDEEKMRDLINQRQKLKTSRQKRDFSKFKF